MQTPMRTRLLLVSHAPSAAQRSGRFAGPDEGLDARGLAAAAAYAQRAPLAGEGAIASASGSPGGTALTSPAACARETAAALGLTATVCDALADTDYGNWRGLRLAELAAHEPQALEAWLRDPAAAPPGGESFDAVRARVGAWLDTLAAPAVTAPDLAAGRTVIAVTHAAVMRAAIVHALGSPSACFAQIEIAPLTTVELRHSATRGWTWWPATDHSLKATARR
jgi:broad specificity phosphatase PhoE